jgi:Cu2+-exporting ATPase
LIRSELSRLKGVDEVQVDVSSGFTRILWQPDELRLSDLADRLLRIGYRPHLPIAAEEERARQGERNASLKRLGVAGLGMMQVMMYAVGLYAGDIQGISEPAQRFLEWVSLLVTTPVLLYSGRVFVEGAIAGLRARRPGMDVPVALAICGAYLASCVNFFSGHGEVWFDSVVMFIFFLSLGRHVEMSIRHRNQQAGSALARLLPEWAERVLENGTETVATDELAPGDVVRVNVGDAFPADGTLLEHSTTVNEALLTGESSYVTRQEGDKVIAGSINTGRPVLVSVSASGEQSTVSALGKLLQRARSIRCRTTDLSEQLAGYFVIGVLLIASLTFAGWYAYAPERAFAVTLSVLVVSCPCAFSLASPAVFAAASRALLRRGIILTRGTALEVLAEVKMVIFDKTGTLTTGEPRVGGIELNQGREPIAEARVAGIAAALEQYSSHPVARAFRNSEDAFKVQDVEVVQGGGIHGWIDGVRYIIGSHEFVSGLAPGLPGDSSEGTWLADNDGWIAKFDLADSLRPGALDLVTRLVERQLEVIMLSGDNESAVADVARELGINRWFSAQTPEKKLQQLARLTGNTNGNVLMVGDGVNDAPVLAAADVSIAVHGGTELANAAADFILTGRSLVLVDEARNMALNARRTIRQNIGWAIAYNVIMIPLAAGGLLQPWMAAVGMSASSLLVVFNAARIGRGASTLRNDVQEMQTAPVQT